MKYMVFEIQDNDSSVGNQVFAYDSPRQAESKYYAVLSAAAVSQVPTHTAYLLTSDGHYIDSRAYDNRPAPTPEEE